MFFFSIFIIFLLFFYLLFRSIDMNYSFASMVHSSSIYEHVLTEIPEETLQSCFVGNYLDSDDNIVEVRNY